MTPNMLTLPRALFGVGLCSLLACGATADGAPSGSESAVSSKSPAPPPSADATPPVIATDSDGGSRVDVCAGGDRSCFDGDPKLAGVGACALGTQTCERTGELGQWGACRGAGTPSAEACGNGVDDDCDGVVDEGCTCTLGATEDCYDGAPATRGVGSCHAGKRTCEALASGGSAFGACTGEVLPKATSPYGVDDDCDGAMACVFASATIAGTLSVLPSTPPEDGTGVAAHFGDIKGVRVDPTNGDVVLVETTSTGARFVRRVTAAGVTTTLGAVDVVLHADLGVGQDGTVYFVEAHAPHKIRVFPKVGPAAERASAPLPSSNVQAFTVDSSDLGWIAMPSPDHSDKVRISRLSMAGGGVAETMFEVPTYDVLDLAVSDAGEVYVATSAQIWRWSAAGGVAPWRSGGAYGIAVDSAGRVATGGTVYSHDGDLLFAVDHSVTPNIQGGSFMSAFDGAGGLYTFDLARFDPQVTYYEYAAIIRHLTGCVLP